MVQYPQAGNLKIRDGVFFFFFPQRCALKSKKDVL